MNEELLEDLDNTLDAYLYLRQEKINDLKRICKQIKIIAAGAVVGFIQFWENREKEFYKQLSKMRLK